jgi:hypothetical protein
MLGGARRQGARNAFRLPLPRAPAAGRPGSRARDARTQAYDAPEVSRDRRMAAEKSNPARHFGREVRRARLAARMTLAEFGRAIGYDPGQLLRRERRRMRRSRRRGRRHNGARQQRPRRSRAGRSRRRVACVHCGGQVAQTS